MRMETGIRVVIGYMNALPKADRYWTAHLVETLTIKLTS